MLPGRYGMISFEKLFNGIYNGITVLVTGHTGFKGSWLSLWLTQMGAKIIGYSKDIPTDPNHFLLLKEKGYFENMIDIRGDIRDIKKLDEVFNKYKPDIVFHLAAQPLVRNSYKNPIETYETNVIGTLKVFEACRKAGVKAIVNITSDKCYENKEWVWGYREIDPMGGYDLYSSSKGCAELLTSSYRNSFFNLNDYKIKHNTLLASCRAGNVIGGGDWAKDRLIPDVMISTSKKEKVKIRKPHATRPWQHVLEPLSGYLMIGQRLLEGKKEFAEGWNFGPDGEGNITVEDVLKNMKNYWCEIDYEVDNSSQQFHEANLLKLDCSKAHYYLKWKSVWDNQKTFEKTARWYKEYYNNNKIMSMLDLEEYINDANLGNIAWTQK
ncbi:MAG: CDP-glucose 4,6-dehydratase [Candidatus Sericytochromatia bacterium]|nr:MAG: CDP-glucose 4,6-dehydratase [Candidatus Sericytochromatia bacterium]GIX42968.1 MAG: CDP-glucose 4,6-dehydratase [Leptospiraceae bacterium]